MGLHGVGHRLVLPAVLGLRRLLSVLLPALPDLRLLAWYNPWTGAYGRSAGVYGPYGGAGVGARYNPRTGTYARGAAAYGPYGARGVAQAYNPRTGTYAATRQGSNVYGSWGSTAVQRGDDWAKTNRYTNRQTGTTTRTIRTDEGGGRHAARRRGRPRRRRRRRQRLRRQGRQRLPPAGRHAGRNATTAAGRTPIRAASTLPCTLPTAGVQCAARVVVAGVTSVGADAAVPTSLLRAAIYTVSATQMSVQAAGGSNSVTVNAERMLLDRAVRCELGDDCQRRKRLRVPAAWASTSRPIQPPPRTGAADPWPAAVTVNQAAANVTCEYSVKPDRTSFSKDGGTGCGSGRRRRSLRVDCRQRCSVADDHQWGAGHRRRGGV